MMWCGFKCRNENTIYAMKIFTVKWTNGVRATIIIFDVEFLKRTESRKEIILFILHRIN